MGRAVWFAVTVVVSAGCVALGFWQLDRRSQRLARNAETLSGQQLPVVFLESATGDPLAYRRVRVRGTFDHDRQIILRGHLWMGAPGVHVVTPLRLADGVGAVLVNRGFVPSADGARPDAPVPEEFGEVELDGIVVPVPSEGGAQSVEREGLVTWRRLDLTPLRNRMPYPLLDVYLLPTTPSSAGAWPRRVDPPALDEGPHLSYAIQWFGIAAAVLGFGIFFVLGQGRRRAAADIVPPPPPE